MAAPDSDLSILGMEVPLGRVDRELQKLWDADEARTRASLMNFAIYTEDPATLAHNNELLEQITAEHSCRALLILCRRAAGPPRARAWINALCRPYEGKKIVCSEQLSFVLDGGNAAQVQNIVFAHLDSDLPLTVWWQGELTSNFEERFYSEIDRLFIDSSQWRDPAAQLARLEAACNGETSDFEVHDLSWTRSHFFRTALAGCFQDALALRALPGVERIAITHAPGQRSAALLLAAWIAKRLGHELAGGKSGGIAFSKPSGGLLELELSEGPPGCCLQRLSLSGLGLDVTLRREEDCAFVHAMTCCGTHQHEELLPADVETGAELISSQLSRAHGTSLYGGMVPMLRRMLLADA